MKKHLFTAIAIMFCVFLNAKDYNDIIAERNSVATTVSRIGNSDVTVKLPEFVFENTNTKIDLQFKDASNPKLIENNYVLNFILNGQEIPVQFDANGKASITHSFKSGENAELMFEDMSYRAELNVISMWMILAPIALIILVIALRFLNVRAKKKVASISIQKTENKPAPKKVVVPEEEEMLA